MKQGDKYMKVVMLVLAIMVTGYLLYSLVRSGSRGVETAQAVLYSTTQSARTQGFLVRQETVIPSGYHLVMATKPEGAKVAKGEEVALSLGSDAARQRQEEILDKAAQLEQLRQALTLQDTLTDTESVSQAISLSAAEFSAQVAKGDLESGSELKALVLRQMVGGQDKTALSRQIESLESELEALRSSASRDTVSITAQEAGYYSAVADGWESLLAPSFLSSVTLEEYQNLWQSQDSPKSPGSNAGKLITASQWYYGALVEPRVLEGMEEGDTLTVRLEGDRELEMTVSRAVKGEEQGLLVLTSRDRLDWVSAERRMEADVVFRSYSGLRVPKEAVCYDNEKGVAGVYVLVGGKARWKTVELLYDLGDAYIARLDQSSTSNLWPQDEILLETQGLYDGKVVE